MPRDTRRLRYAYWSILRRLGVRDDTLRHEINLRMTGKPSTKGWLWIDWRGAVEILKALEHPDQREALLGQPDTELWTVDDWQHAILEIRRALREPDLPPELSYGATQRQLRYLRDLAAQIAWREPDGFRKFVAKVALTGRWSEPRLDRWVEQAGPLESLTRQEADVAIRRLRKERRLQQQRQEAASV